jgi:molybdopterin synthase sulfur carrier subunit
MVKVEFLGPIGKSPVEVEASSLSELANALKHMDGVSEWLGKSAVAINDTMTTDLNAPLSDGDKVSILPPVCGG